MECQLLDLNFSQLIKAWSKSKHNVYSDKAKQDYHNNLKILFDNLKNENFCALDDDGRLKCNLILDFFFRSIEFLDNSTHNLIPFEIVECLKIALKDWIPDNDNKFIIVTSYVNNMLGFSFDPTLATNKDIYNCLKNRYNIEFTNKLIQINLPKYLSRDYLANVVLYHELGHFLDLYYNITAPISEELSATYSKLDPSEISVLKAYFPFLDDPVNLYQFFPMLISNHLREYFADVFASQYINSCSCKYLDYITNSDANCSLSHPSTINRNKLVEEFLIGKNNILLNKIMESTKIITNLSLQKRFDPIDGNDFMNLIPIDIENPEKLHSLFLLGWDFWLQGPKYFSSYNGMSEALKPGQYYQIINNLIEKSIGNYIIKVDWEKIKK